MNLVVNGDPLTIDEGATLTALIVHLGLDRGPVAVERNGAVVPRAEHCETRLQDGDQIEIVHFVGGG